MKGTFVGLFLLVVGACAEQASIDHFEAIQDKDSLSIILDRAECFGTCASYIVEIRANGSVNYCGELFVEASGVRSKTVPVEDVQSLFNTIISSGFLEFEDQYAYDVTDGPTYQLQIAFDGKTKRVIDYMGHEVGMPEIITELEQAVDRVAGTAEWIGNSKDWAFVNQPQRAKCENRFYNPFF